MARIIALKRKAPQRLIPKEWEIGTFNGPAHERGFIHVWPESGHDAEMRRVVYERSQRIFVPPNRERPESLREGPGEKRITNQAIRRSQLLHHLRGIEEEARHAPITFQW